jgi:hypothetical protein
LIFPVTSLIRHWPCELLGNPILKFGSSLLHCQFYQRRRTPDWLIINP